MTKNKSVQLNEEKIDSIYENLPPELKELVEYGVLTKEEACKMVVKSNCYKKY